MSALIIDGKKLANYYHGLVKSEVESFVHLYKKAPILSLIVIGSDDSSIRYVNSKQKLARSLGIEANIYNLNEDLEIQTLVNEISEINSKSHSVLLQLPLPKKLEGHTKVFLSKIHTDKDCDAISEEKIKYIETCKSLDLNNDILPCTPLAIVFLIQTALKELKKNIDINGLNVVVLGNSDLVGRPTTLMLRKLGGKVSSLNSKTKEEDRISALFGADIVVSAVGKLNLVKADHLKTGSIVVDVGINYDNNGKIAGDVDFDHSSKVCSAITPVPGGVGPMTLAMLMRNVIILAKNQEKIANTHG